MPAPDGDDLTRTLAWIDRLSPAQREQLYLQLLARGHVTARVGPAAPRLVPQVATEAQPLDERDFLRRRLPASGVGDELRTASPRGRRSHPSSIELVLHDVDGLAPRGLELQVARAVSQQLARLDEMGPAGYRGVLRSRGYQFVVRWREGEGTAREKAATRPLVYPLYLLAEDARAARLLRIVREHGVPEVVAGTRLKVADHIRSEWSNHLRGTTAPPGLGLALYRKCAFLSHRILSEGGGDATLIANVVLHEFGHMNNIMRRGYAHPSDGSVMQTRLVTSALQSHVRPFNEQHAADILRQIDILWSIEQSLRPSP